MLLSSVSRAEMPKLCPIETAPRWQMPVADPPLAGWIGVGRHGSWAREDYRVPGLWCIHLYQWTGAMQIDGIALPVRPGYVSVVPPGFPLSHFFGRLDGTTRIHLSAGFSLPAADLLEPENQNAVSVPAMQDLGDAFGPIFRIMEEAVRKFATNPRRAESHLWEVIWRIAENRPALQSNSDDASDGKGNGFKGSPIVRQAQEMIELQLADPHLRVADLADAMELSQSQLTRLFHAQCGTTVQRYIRDRRIAGARRLLLYSTIPIKSIAAQVGLPDLHQFNKTVRIATGQSPRAHRLSFRSEIDDGPATTSSVDF